MMFRVRCTQNYPINKILLLIFATEFYIWLDELSYEFSAYFRSSTPEKLLGNGAPKLISTTCISKIGIGTNWPVEFRGMIAII
jgi:hypothetical protein